MAVSSVNCEYGTVLPVIRRAERGFKQKCKLNSYPRTRFPLILLHFIQDPANYYNY